MASAKDKRYNINEKQFKNILAFLVAAYFLITPLDYILKIGDNNFSYLRIVGIAIYIAGAAWALLTGKIRITKFHLVMIYLAAFPYLASLWSIDVSRGFNRAFSIATTVLVVFIVSWFEFEKKHIRLIEYCAVIGAVIVGIVLISDQGFVKFINGGRIYLSGKETSDPNGMAGRLIMPLIISAMMIVKEKKWYQRVFLLLSFLLILLLFFMCGSRGGLVALTVSFAVFVFRFLTTAKVGKAGGSAIVLILIAAVVLVFFSKNILPDAIYGRLFSADNYIGMNSRSSIWKVFFSEYYWKSPVFGYGTFGIYFKIGEYFGHEFYAVHNSYFCMLGEYGIFYLPAFLALIAGIRKKLTPMNRPALIMILYAVCGVIFFLDAYDAKYFWNMILYLIIVSDQFERETSENNVFSPEVQINEQIVSEK